tara:strand:+ start:769 stop:1071 length:303 start_codon:yes stop_codon:yes gene_type:complete
MINKKEIHKIASLAKIDIKDSELDAYSEQISKILDYVAKLNEVDTSNVEEFSGDVLNSHQNLREDLIEDSLDREDVVKLAPESDGIYFKVPKVIKEEGDE